MALEQAFYLFNLMLATDEAGELGRQVMLARYFPCASVIFPSRMLLYKQIVSSEGSMSNSAFSLRLQASYCSRAAVR